MKIGISSVAFLIFTNAVLLEYAFSQQLVWEEVPNTTGASAEGFGGSSLFGGDGDFWGPFFETGPKSAVTAGTSTTTGTYGVIPVAAQSGGLIGNYNLTNTTDSHVNLSSSFEAYASAMREPVPGEWIEAEASTSLFGHVVGRYAPRSIPNEDDGSEFTGQLWMRGMIVVQLLSTNDEANGGFFAEAGDTIVSATNGVAEITRQNGHSTESFTVFYNRGTHLVVPFLQPIEIDSSYRFYIEGSGSAWRGEGQTSDDFSATAAGGALVWAGLEADFDEPIAGAGPIQNIP